MATIRTVSTHGAPTGDDLPVVEWSHAYNGKITSVSDKDRTYWQPEDRWVPVSEIENLPPTPLPPVTITIPRESEHGPPFLAVFEVYREMNGAHLTAGDMADDLNAAIAAIEFDETEPGRERAVRYLDEQAMEAQHLHEWLRSGGGS